LNPRMRGLQDMAGLMQTLCHVLLKRNQHPHASPYVICMRTFAVDLSLHLSQQT